MKKLLCIALAAMLACLMATAALAFEPVGNVEIPFSPAPTIDGNIEEGEWGQSTIIDLSNCVSWVGTVPEDHVIEFYTAWDDTNLYIGGVVTDPDFTEGKDMFQLSLDLNKGFAQAAANRAIFYSWALSSDCTVDVVRQESDNDATIADLGMGQKTETGWVFEVALSFEMLADDYNLKSWDPVAELKAGSEIGALVCYLDHDASGTLTNAYGTPNSEKMDWTPATHGMTFVLVDAEGKSEGIVTKPVETDPPATDPIGTEKPDDDDKKTDPPATKAPADDTDAATKAPDDKKEGCGSMIGAASLLVVAAVAVACGKKRR